MANCRNCGTPLNKGNIQVIRKPGKRPFRIHRLCPFKVDPKLTEISTSYQARSEVIQISNYIEDTGSPLQRPQDNTGDPIVVEGVLDYPPKYRYFVLPASVEKLKKAIEKGDAWFWGFASNWSAGITIEIIPVLEEVAEMNPEAVEHYVEIEIKWKGE